jgi:hypothetical protein
VVGFLEDLDQAVHEGGNPEEPFEQGRQHDDANDDRIDDLMREGCRLYQLIEPWSAADLGGVVYEPRGLASDTALFHPP